MRLGSIAAIRNMKSDTINVFIIDDDPAVRESLALLLEDEDFCVNAFPSAEAFLAGLDSVPPRSCAIVDIRMPGMDGMQLQRELGSRQRLLPLIFLTGHGDIPTSVRAVKAGAVDFLVKPVGATALLASIRAAVSEGERQYRLAEENECAASRLAALTERELDVMKLLVSGLANKEIARRLGISHRTVEIHKARVMQKTDSEHVLDLARLAEAAGQRN